MRRDRSVEPIEKSSPYCTSHPGGSEQEGSSGETVDLNPPWINTRTVVQEKTVEGTDGDRTDADYIGLKRRLDRVPTRKTHKRQRLYLDPQTRQYWLGLTVSVTHLFERLEVLKPLPVDTAESLLA